jgi:hypothetical protein
MKRFELQAICQSEQANDHCNSSLSLLLLLLVVVVAVVVVVVVVVLTAIELSLVGSVSKTSKETYI